MPNNNSYDKFNLISISQIVIAQLYGYCVYIVFQFCTIFAFPSLFSSRTFKWHCPHQTNSYIHMLQNPSKPRLFCNNTWLCFLLNFTLLWSLICRCVIGIKFFFRNKHAALLNVCVLQWIYSYLKLNVVHTVHKSLNSKVKNNQICEIKQNENPANNK